MEANKICGFKPKDKKICAVFQKNVENDNFFCGWRKTRDKKTDRML
jgi:hypothetical protein